MEKNGDYQVVFGITLDQIPKGDLKVMINGHGNSDGIGQATKLTFFISESLPTALFITPRCLAISSTLLSPIPSELPCGKKVSIVPK
jgi:hypothetical protein